MENKEVHPTFVEQRKKPKPLGKDGYWIVARRNPQKSIPEAWQWIKGGQTPTMEELPPQGLENPSPMYPTTKPPREDVPMGGVPRGDRD
jgi:hypothetical protein